VFKLYPAPGQDTAYTTLHVTKFGQPAAGVDLYLGTGKPLPPFTFPDKVTTDANGRAAVAITGADPGNPRPTWTASPLRHRTGSSARSSPTDS